MDNKSIKTLIEDKFKKLEHEGWLDHDWYKNLDNDNKIQIQECIIKSTSPRSNKSDESINKDDIELIFNAFSLFHPEETKVLIIGQDPYPEAKKAQGIAFSCKTGKAHSLTKIFKAVEKYRTSKNREHSYNLLNWATRYKILLLNTALTFEKSKMFEGEYKYKKDLSKEKQKAIEADQQNLQNRHLEIWNNFTVSIIKKLIAKNSNLVVFLWGNKANKLFKSCPGSEKIKNVFETCHPHKRLRKGEDDKFLIDAPKHFEKCDNKILVKEKIWQNL